VLALVIQLFRPARTNPSFDPAGTLQARTHLTPEVAAVLDRACLDCHSNQTRWPWYSEVVPVSWFVANHVAQGRRHMNFSVWSEKPKVQAHDLAGMCEQVKRGDMPLASYTLIHRSSKLSSQDVRLICDWTKAEREQLSAERERGGASGASGGAGAPGTPPPTTP